MTDHEKNTVKEIATDYFKQYPNENELIIERYLSKEKRWIMIKIKKE